MQVNLMNCNCKLCVSLVSDEHNLFTNVMGLMIFSYD